MQSYAWGSWGSWGKPPESDVLNGSRASLVARRALSTDFLPWSLFSSSSLHNEFHSQSLNMSTDPKYDELHQQLFEEGLKMRRGVVGDEYVNRALENGSTEFSRAGQELVTEWCWGYAWTRPGLSKQQRSLINIGMLMALNRAPELAVHIRGARNNGLSELEIREAIIHATTYCGVPAGVDAMKTAEKVLNDMAEKGEMARELGNKSDKA